MTPQKQKWIVDHAGNNLGSHNIYYRCTPDFIERSAVAKLLMMMDKKQMGYFKNKRLKKNRLEGFLISRGFDYNSYQTENYLKKTTS